MPNDLPKYDLPASLIRFDRPLFHLAKQLEGAGPVNIVAIGSSTTAGEGDIPPYPARLQAALRRRFPGPEINVINKGLGGQEAPEEFKRFEQDVIALAPVLTIWQVGTNAIFHDGYDLDDIAATIDAGLKWLSGHAMDVVLMDLQYASAIRGPGRIFGTERMVRLIADAADRAGVNLFRRFALMRHWVKDGNVPIDQLINPADGLHQTELCTGWVTQALDTLISDAVARAYPPVPTH
jgi:lysophospholipase L1-like esterase